MPRAREPPSVTATTPGIAASRSAKSRANASTYAGGAIVMVVLDV